MVVITGCYAQLKPEEISSIEGVDLVLGAKEKFNLVHHLQQLTKGDATKIWRTDPAMALYFQEQIKRKNSKIVIIKIARKLLSRIRYVLINQQPYEFGIVK